MCFGFRITFSQPSNNAMSNWLMYQNTTTFMKVLSVLFSFFFSLWHFKKRLVYFWQDVSGNFFYEQIICQQHNIYLLSASQCYFLSKKWLHGKKKILQPWEKNNCTIYFARNWRQILPKTCDHFVIYHIKHSFSKEMVKCILTVRGYIGIRSAPQWPWVVDMQSVLQRTWIPIYRDNVKSCRQILAWQRMFEIAWGNLGAKEQITLATILDLDERCKLIKSKKKNTYPLIILSPVRKIQLFNLSLKVK